VKIFEFADINRRNFLGGINLKRVHFGVSYQITGLMG